MYHGPGAEAGEEEVTVWIDPKGNFNHYCFRAPISTQSIYAFKILVDAFCFSLNITKVLMDCFIQLNGYY